MTVLTNARIVLHDQVFLGSLTLRGPLIGSISDGRSALPGAIDCAGDFLIPGIVDVQSAWPESTMSGHWPACVQHVSIAFDIGRAGHVLAAAGEWRMMDGDDKRLGILVFRVGLAIACIALEFAGEESELIRADGRVAKGAGSFSGVGVEADDADKRRIEGKVDAGLRHGGAIEAGRALRGTRGAEIIDESFAGVAGRLALEHETVVVAGDGKDGSGVVAIGLVKLFGIVGLEPKK